ncbi:MAG: carboxypeptidase-like regulatory domain-containing protein [Sphingomonas sp.]
MPLAGAEVTVTDTRTGAERTITTGSAGTFLATNLVTGGPYTISANAEGYEGQSLEGVITTLQGNTSLAFSLASGAERDRRHRHPRGGYPARGRPPACRSAPKSSPTRRPSTATSAT